MTWFGLSAKAAGRQDDDSPKASLLSGEPDHEVHGGKESQRLVSMTLFELFNHTCPKLNPVCPGFFIK